MKRIFRQYWAVALMFILVTGVCLLFSVRKSGMFIDEIYTYGLSNSDHAPYLSDLKGGEMTGKTFTRQELLDYVTVAEGEGLAPGSVYYNQAMDVHPPLYYWLFNAVSALAGPVFSKWTGLILDYVIYMLALFALYKLAMKLFSRRETAAAAVILYGLSGLGLSTMLMIRMYVLMTLLTLWLAYLIASLAERFSKRDCVLAGLCIFLGLMTQYYFVFYAFFLCAALVIYLLIKRRGRELLWFMPCGLAGAALLLAAFPACLTQLFADKLVSGGSALENLTDLSQYAGRLGYFFAEARHGLKAAIVVGLLAALALLLLWRKLRLAGRLGLIRLDSLLLIVPAFVTFALVAVISPVTDQRYIYNLAPIFVLTVCLALYLIDRALWDLGEGSLKKAALLLVAALALWVARCAPPQYLYPEYNDYNALLAEHSGSPCVYFTDEHFEPMTQDLGQLTAFDEVYVTDREHCAAVADYTGDAPEFVGYIDISEYWSSGYDEADILARVAADTGYKRAEPLYQNGLSATYVFYQ